MGADQPGDRERTVRIVDTARCEESMMVDRQHFLEMDTRIKEIIGQTRSVFPNADLRQAIEFYDHGEWELALDAVIFALESLNSKAPLDLYEKIVSASERMNSFPASHYDAIKPGTN
jgi:hypothetical protein